MLSSSPKQLCHEWAMHFPNPPVSTYAIACTWLFPPSLLPVEIPHLLQGTAHILLLPWCQVLVMILLKILNLAFEHRAPFYCILYTWCYYRLPSCHLVLFFWNWCTFKILCTSICLASLSSRSQYPWGQTLGASSAYSQVKNALTSESELLSTSSFVVSFLCCFGQLYLFR